MNLDTLFALSNTVVLPFWLLMIFVPRAAWAVRIIRSPLIAVPPALIYALVILPSFTQSGPGIFESFGSIAGVSGLLATPQGTVLGWAHFLAFDLFVGRWVYLDALERRIPAPAIAPALVLTFMLGPLGLLLYLIIRGAFSIMRRNAPPAPNR